MALKLFRRHEKRCSRGYGKEERIHEWDNPKTTGRVQCDCPIAVDGRLGNVYLKAKATGCRDWESARRVLTHWERFGAATEVSLDTNYRLVSVPEAIESFYMVQRNKGISEDRIKQYRQLLTLRLLPFARSRSINYIQEMDRARIWAEFRNSWRNQNPLHNKQFPDEPLPDVQIGKRTISRMIGDLRIFINHCISNEWLSENWAHRKHGMVTTKVKDPKEPFSDQDLDYIYKAVNQVTDGKGWKEKRKGTTNSREDLAFALTLRYTGLRISDVCALKASQLVRLAQPPWTHAISCYPMKTSTTRDKGNHVLIPIPNGQLPGHHNLVAALEALPLKHGEYFFLGGGPLPEYGTAAWRSRIKYATNRWRERMTRLFGIAEQLLKEEDKQFSVHPHPHRFRHTFCAWLLQRGLSLRTVASYIGDTEDTVRAHYGKFCRAEQMEAARAFGEAVSRPASMPGVNYQITP